MGRDEKQGSATHDKDTVRQRLPRRVLMRFITSYTGIILALVAYYITTHTTEYPGEPKIIGISAIATAVVLTALALSSRARRASGTAVIQSRQERGPSREVPAPPPSASGPELEPTIGGVVAPPTRNYLRELVELAGQQAESELQNVDMALFSPPAFDILRATISEFIIELVKESIKVSKRDRADTISAKHVTKASEYLAAHHGRQFFRHFGTLGGLLLGASISNFLAMILTISKTISITITFVMAIIGAGMLGFHFAGKD